MCIDEVMPQNFWFKLSILSKIWREAILTWENYSCFTQKHQASNKKVNISIFLSYYVLCWQIMKHLCNLFHFHSSVLIFLLESFLRLWSWIVPCPPKQLLHAHCTKSVPIWSYSGQYFSAFGEIWGISSYSIQMRGNVDQNNSEQGRFLLSDYV